MKKSPRVVAGLRRNLLRRIVRDFGAAGTVAALTLVCAIGSILVVFALRLLVFGEVRLTDIIVAICMPVVMVPIASSFFVFLIRDLDLIETKLGLALAETSELKAQAELKATEMALIFSSIPGHVSVADRNGRYSRTNGFAKERLFKQGIVEGARVGESEFDGKLSDKIIQFLGSEAIDDGFEIALVEPRGDQVTWWLVALVKGEAESDLGLLILAQDITHQKNLEKELKKEHARWLQAQRFAAVGTLAAGMAHEINNPLGIISGRIAILDSLFARNSVTDEKLFIKQIVSMKKSVERISRIVSSLLEYARPTLIDNRARYSCEHLVDQVFELSKGLNIQECIAVRYLKFGSLKTSYCFVDLDQILNAFKNIMTNAVEETIRSNSEVQVWIEIKASLGDFLTITVANSGLGICSEIRSKVFDPFFTTKAVGSGMGLGLTIARVLAEANGCQVYLDDHVPFAAFVIEIPIDQLR